MLWVHHTHDASLWPLQGIGMKNNVERERGAEEAQQALPAALDRERRARPRRFVPLHARPGQQHLADRLPARSSSSAWPTWPTGSKTASSPPAPASTTPTARSPCRPPPPSGAASSRSCTSPPTAAGRAEVKAGEAVTLTSTPKPRRGRAPSSPPSGTSTAPAPTPSTRRARRHRHRSHPDHHPRLGPTRHLLRHRLVQSHLDGDINATSAGSPTWPPPESS